MKFDGIFILKAILINVKNNISEWNKLFENNQENFKDSKAQKKKWEEKEINEAQLKSTIIGGDMQTIQNYVDPFMQALLYDIQDMKGDSLSNCLKIINRGTTMEKAKEYLKLLDKTFGSFASVAGWFSGFASELINIKDLILKENKPIYLLLLFILSEFENNNFYLEPIQAFMLNPQINKPWQLVMEKIPNLGIYDYEGHVFPSRKKHGINLWNGLNTLNKLFNILMLNMNFDEGIDIIEYLKKKGENGKLTKIERDTLFNIKYGFKIRHKLGDKTIIYEEIKEYYEEEEIKNKKDSAVAASTEAAPAEADPVATKAADSAVAASTEAAPAEAAAAEEAADPAAEAAAAEEAAAEEKPTAEEAAAAEAAAAAAPAEVAAPAEEVDTKSPGLGGGELSRIQNGGSYENDEKLKVIIEFGKKKTMIKILEKKFIWLGKSLFFVDYLVQNIISKLESYKSDQDCTIINDIIEDMKSFLMVPESVTLNYNLIDFTPNIFAVSENIDYVNSNKEDKDFINDVFNSPFYNQRYFRMCDDLTNIIFGKKDYNKELELSLDNFVNQISYYYEKVGNLDKISLNPSKLHFLEIWKFKLVSALKNHYKKQLKKKFDEFDSNFEEKLEHNRIDEEDLKSFKISEKNRKKMMSFDDDELDDDEIEELDDISKKEAVYLDLQKNNDMAKNKIAIKLKNEIRQKKLLIKNGGYFDYIINKYLDSEDLPIYLEQKYKNNKSEFSENLNELGDVLKKQNNNGSDSDSKMKTLEFIDRITTNFENIKTTNSKYDIKTAISEIKLMSYLENSNYLELMSIYAKLTDNLRIINQYEEENDLVFTPKPEILNLIEKLYLNSLAVDNQSYNTYNTYNTSIEPRTQRRGSKKKKSFSRSSSSFDDDDDNKKNKNNEGSMFDSLNSFFDIFKTDDNEEIDVDNIVVKVDEAAKFEVDDIFDSSDDSSVLVNPENIS